MLHWCFYLELLYSYATLVFLLRAALAMRYCADLDDMFVVFSESIFEVF